MASGLNPYSLLNQKYSRNIGTSAAVVLSIGITAVTWCHAEEKQDRHMKPIQHNPQQSHKVPLSSTLITSPSSVSSLKLKSIPQNVIHASELRDCDRFYFNLINESRLKMRKPKHSNFRVVCVIVYEDSKGAEKYVLGANAESAFIGGSICAERAAVCQLQLRDCLRIKSLYLSSDSEKYVTPGVLCREFLLDHAHRSTPVYMSDENGTLMSTLGDLYPYPSIYSGLSREHIFDFITKVSKNTIEFSKEGLEKDELLLLKKIVHLTKNDDNDQYHPIRYAAGVLYCNGQWDISWQHKTIEWGNSIDPVSKLIPNIEKNALRGIYPVKIMQADQFGILHAPFAAARAFLTECGFRNVKIFTHDQHGNLVTMTSGNLVPNPPNHIKDVFNKV